MDAFEISMKSVFLHSEYVLGEALGNRLVRPLVNGLCPCPTVAASVGRVSGLDIFESSLICLSRPFRNGRLRVRSV